MPIIKRSGRTWAKAVRIELLRQFGGECYHCASKGTTWRRRLEFAHKYPCRDGPGRGSNNRMREVLRHPENFLLLCRPCHIAFDSRFYVQIHGHIKIKGESAYTTYRPIDRRIDTGYLG
jgi:hypothetical protein